MQFQNQSEILISYLFENIINFHSDIAKLCVKINNFNNIEYILEDHSKNLSIDFNILLLLLYGYNPALINFNISSLLGMKTIRERLIEKYSFDTNPITIEDVLKLNNFKDIIIKTLKTRIIELDSSIASINMNFQNQIQNINNLQKGIDVRIETVSSLLEPLIPSPVSDMSISPVSPISTESLFPVSKLIGLPKENITFNFLSQNNIWK
jgi:hypothetical protein